MLKEYKVKSKTKDGKININYYLAMDRLELENEFKIFRNVGEVLITYKSI